MRVIIVALAFIGCGMGLFGQAEQQRPPVFRGGIDVVQLDVSVLDASRRPVHGLTARDFTVTENGRPQPVVAVTEIADDTGAPPVWMRAAPPDVASNDISDKRVFAIVSDGGLYPDLVSAVANRLGPGDVIAMIGGGCYVPFTEDVTPVFDCLDALRQRVAPPTPLLPPPSQYAAKHHVLRDVSEYLAAVPQRRKAILYVGNGFTLSGNGPAPMGSRTPEEMRQDFSETLWFAQVGNINIYTFNSGDTSPSLTGDLDASASLRTLAEETGGQTLDRSKLSSSLRQMFLENGAYYLVGFQTLHPEMDGKFRKLSIKVNRADATVRARTRTFRPKSATTVMAAAVPSHGLTGGLSDWMRNLDVGFSTAVMPFAGTDRDTAAVAIVTEISEPVSVGVTRIVQKMDVRVLAYAEGGALALDTTRRATIDVDVGADNRVRYNVLQQIALEPGRYDLRITAHNPDTDKIGALEFTITVPHFEKEPISLSGVGLAVDSRESPNAEGDLRALLPIVPTAVRRFRSGDRVTAFMRVYQGGVDRLSAAMLQTTILDARGVSHYDVTRALPADRFDEARATDVRLDLPMADLQAGEYLLTFRVMLGARHMQRDIPFTIR